MKFKDFQELHKEKYIFSTKNIQLIISDFSIKQLNTREKRWRIKHLTRWWRYFPKIIKFQWYETHIANTLYEPSYLSLEWALRFYNLIPEGVFLITSCSTKKTQNFQTEIWSFCYKSITPKLYFWYNLYEIGKYKAIRIASPEKAICDFLYFHSEIKTRIDFEEMRLNKLSRLDIANQEILKKYSKQYPKRVQKSMSEFFKYIND